jgi:MGT family glycosyltransferase
MGRFLFFPLFTSGHLNVCISIAQRIQLLYPTQHEFFILIDQFNRAKYQLRFPDIKWIEFQLPSTEPNDLNKNDQTTSSDAKVGQDMILDMMLEESQFWPLEPLAKEIAFMPFYMDLIGLFEQLEPEINRQIDLISPDVILIDQLFSMPIGMDRKIPWVMINSSAENFIGQDDMPPPKSGLAAESDVSQWQEHRQRYSEGMRPMWDHLNLWLLRRDCATLRPGYMYNVSPHLNICNTPTAISLCNDHVQLTGRWARLQSAVLPPTSTQSDQLDRLIEQLRLERNGKPIVYFSLGSMAFVRIDLMQKVIDWLDDIDCQVVVSAGRSVKALQPNCPDNVRLVEFVPQTILLPAVDLMISHGGNNTLTECLHWGVPLLILPLFSDQHCNAARVTERGCGATLNPFTCTRQQFRDTVRALLTDVRMTERVRNIGCQIRQDNGLDQVCRQVIDLIL